MAQRSQCKSQWSETVKGKHTENVPKDFLKRAPATQEIKPTTNMKLKSFCTAEEVAE